MIKELFFIIMINLLYSKYLWNTIQIMLRIEIEKIPIFNDWRNNNKSILNNSISWYAINPICQLQKELSITFFISGKIKEI